MSATTTIERTPFGSLRSRTRGDKVIWTAVFLLAIVSLLVVYSSTGLLAYKMYKGNTEVYLFKQFAFILVGVGDHLFRPPGQLYHSIPGWRKSSSWSIPLLLYTLFFGVKLNEGSRWIRLPIINMTFQTSDLAKLALFMYLSRLLSKKQEIIKDFRTGFLPVITPVASSAC
jgi:cell division protein FtsW